MQGERTLPAVFVRELVVFPGVSVTLTVGREASRLAVLLAQRKFSNALVTLTQLRAEDPKIESLDAVYKVGTICKIEKVIALTDGGMQVHITGLERFEGCRLEWREGAAVVTGAALREADACSQTDGQKILELMSSYQPGSFDAIAWIERTDPEELRRINERIAKRQKILEEPSAQTRMRMLKALEP